APGGAPGGATGDAPGDATAGVAAPPKVDRKKQVIAGLVTLVVLVIVFVGIFPKFANYSAAWDSIQQMSIAAVAALLVATVVNIVVYVFPYNAALPSLNYGDAFNVRQTSFMISNAVPAGGAFGVGVQYAMLSGYGVGPAVASSGIGITSVWNLLVTLALPVLGVLALLTQGGVTTNEVLGALGGLVALVLLVGALALVLRSESWARKLGGWGDAVIHRFRPSASPTMATDGVVRFRDQTVDVVRDRWGLITAANFGQQFCQFLVLLVAIYGLGGESTGVNPVEIFAAFALARLAGFIPITPGGLGTVDAALVGLLSAFGMNKDQALAADLLWRAATLLPQIVIGVVTFLIWRVQSSRRHALV
ncbi:MAG: lysylphosphatidylglycerol synthase transmembrane domain-containing protein, partial [Microthrixaceae bacterium]